MNGTGLHECWKSRIKKAEGLSDGSFRGCRSKALSTRLPTSWSVVRQLSADSGGLGEPFGKASLANTSSGLSTLSPGKQEFLPCRTPISQSIEAWPCEALERGLDRPPKKTKKKLGRAGNRKSLKSAFQREI
jgi:hypothetical protein